VLPKTAAAWLLDGADERMDSAGEQHGGTTPRPPRASGLAQLVHRLQRRPRRVDPNARYRTLFECVSDGFALVQVIRDADRRVVDYVVLEANPALLRMLGMDSSPVGKLQSEVLRAAPKAWLQACQAAVDGQPINFEYHRSESERWFDIHLSRIGPDQLAQLVVEITARKRAERQRTEMFDELNHRVKNNLALVSAMLGLQARSASSAKVREQLEAAVERIQTVADVHGSLYRTGRTDDVEFAAYLRDLCDRLGASMLDGGRVQIELQAETTVLPLDKAVALGVVVNELVTNAAKHAYPPPHTGKISVELKRAENALSLTVGDSGPGLPNEVESSRLGMRLVRSLVQQIGGRLVVEHSPGATFHVHLPHVRAPDPPVDGALF
jgi:two-component sensor histidine kinase